MLRDDTSKPVFVGLLGDIDQASCWLIFCKALLTNFAACISQLSPNIFSTHSPSPSNSGKRNSGTIFFSLLIGLNHRFTRMNGWHGLMVHGYLIPELAHNTSRLKVRDLLPKLINNPTSSLYAFR